MRQFVHSNFKTQTDRDLYAFSQYPHCLERNLRFYKIPLLLNRKKGRRRGWGEGGEAGGGKRRGGEGDEKEEDKEEGGEVV